MPQTLHNLFVCPGCRMQSLRVFCETDPGIYSSNRRKWIRCTCCGSDYDIRNGIPRFVDPNNYAESFGYQWTIHRSTQLDSISGLSMTRDRLFAVSGWPEDMKGMTILEAGSGAGRFTEVLLSTGAEVFSFDYSSAVDANLANNGHHPNLHLFQGDIYNIPLKKNAFDKAMCLGVLQHTPDPAKAFENLSCCVRPGGDLAIDVYSKRFASMLSWKYLLRPAAKRLKKERLHRLCGSFVTAFLPLSIRLHRIGFRTGRRLLPIASYPQLGLPFELHHQMAVLDTFDMYSPAHDHPQSISTVTRWFHENGFENVHVRYGPNGIIGRGRRSP